MFDYVEMALLLVVIYLVLSKSQKTETNQTISKTPVVLDTSALIDGRVVDITRSGFIPKPLIVPEFVVAELQLLADGRDAHKRERARFGLDIISELQKEFKKSIILDKTDFPNIRATDEKLVELAKKKNAKLCTFDFNLNKVAVVKGVDVLNINELAQAVRPPALPGEKHIVKIVQKGSSRNQGVGYLEDGTMVVVNDAGRMMNQKVEVTVTRFFQTEAGKMIFAKVSSQSSSRRTR